jgi:predicted kinase
MSKISPAYREDSYEGLPLDVKHYLDKHFLASLPNLEVENPKLLVVFSGGNAVGKSSLSQKIAKELHGVILENDAVKLHILEYIPNIDRERLQLLTWQYTMNLYWRCGDIKNGLIIRDGVIDWYYDRILPIFEKQGYEIFIIGYDLSKEKLIQLIHSRGDKPTVSAARLISQLGDHEIHQKRFRKVYTPDIILNDESVFDHDTVIGMIRSKINKRAT